MADRKDGFSNMLTGLGVMGVDSQRATKFIGDEPLSDKVLSDLYRSDGLARRIVELPVRDALREGFRVLGDTDGAIVHEMATTGLLDGFKETLRLADLFGVGFLFLGIKDGRSSAEPVGESGINEISFYRTYEKVECQGWTVDEDATTNNYGKPLVYTFVGGSDGFEVHYQRIIRIDGVWLPRDAFVSNGFFHDSVLQSAYRSIKRVALAYSSSERAMSEASVYVMKIQGLLEMLSQGDEDIVVNRLNHNDMTRNMMNMIGIDAESEDLTRDTISLGGISELLRKFEESISIDTGIPNSLLMGAQSTGLAGGDATGVEFYYDKIRSKQSVQLAVPLKQLLSVLALSMGFTEKVEVLFNDLHRTSLKEEIVNKQAQANIDKMHYEMGVLFSQEIRESRFGGTSYSHETKISGDSDPTSLKQLELDIKTAQMATKGA